MAGTTLKNGAAFSLMLPVLLLPQCVLFCLFGDFVPAWARPACSLILSALLYAPAALLVKSALPGTLEALGVFAPLIIVNAIVFVRCDGFARTHVLPAALVDAVGHCLGFALAICAVSFVRELLVFGTVWGKSAEWLGKGNLPALNHAFAGFLVLGFFAAFVQWLRNRRAQRLAKREEDAE